MILEKLFGPDHFEGLAATWSAILAPMRERPASWHRQADVVTAAVEAGHNPKTISKLISDALQHGRLEKRGEYGGNRGGRRNPDTRELRMADVMQAALR